ncbi:acyltransferase [Paenibacillus rhizovicinus]|uniref:Acyltransferase n=1 Tax=Paenibacillus rhizovicinus TaxID=2704463 RepID=A0A6C0P4D7_9BACL|nr:acyltransferase [Paenibacillus rhizovicinus]QHW33388.1 acyltransferase [Paenibacillus rhizovicinus]
MKTSTIAAAGRMNKERVPELEMLRGIAILGVLMVHSTSKAVVEVPNSILRGFYIFLNTFSLFCVPAFVFLSGFVLFYNYFERPLTLFTIRTFYRKRLRQLVLPYLFVSLGYELVMHALNHRAWQPAGMLRQFGEHLLTGKSYAHLYYILITIQLYVLFPLLLLLFRKLRMPVKLAIPFGFAVQWAFYLLNRYYWHLEAKGDWSFMYFSAFLIGAYLGMRSDAFKNWFMASGTRRSFMPKLLSLAWVGVTFGFVWMYDQYRTGAPAPAGYWFEIGYNLFTLLTTLVMLKVCVWLRRHAVVRLATAALTNLGALSFGIYLIHPLFLLIYHRHPLASAQPPAYLLWTAGGFLFALGASVVVLLLAHRFIYWSWIVLGPAPAKLQSRRARVPSVEVLLTEALDKG